MCIDTMDQPECESTMSGSVALVFRISRWSGMAPLSLTRLKNSWRVTLSPSFTVFGYLLVTGINIILSLTVMWDMMTERSRSVRVRSDTRLVVWLADVGVMLTSVSVATYTSAARMRSNIACFNTMQKELKITTFKWHETSERNRSTFFIAWSTAQIVVLIYDYFLIQKSSLENGAMMEISYLYIFYYLCYWLTNLLEMQFTMIAMHILSSFRAINEHLSKILQDTRMWSSSKFSTGIASSINFGKPLHDSTDSLGIERKRKIRTTESKCTISNQTFQEAIGNLSLCYATLCDVLREVDRCHGSVVFILLMSCVLQLIVTPFYLVYSIFNERAMQRAEGEVPNIILQIFWIIFHSVTLFALVEPGQYTHIEIEKTKELVSRLMRFANPTFDPMSARLEQFYQQIMLNQVAYSPLGVTILGRPLIASLFGTIMTYLLFIIKIP